MKRSHLRSCMITVLLAGAVCVAPSVLAQTSADDGPPAQQEVPETQATASKASETPAATDYVIGPEDVLSIDVFNVPELSKTVRVANDGSIMVMLLGRVEAAGLTTRQLRKELERRYGQTYLQNPQVSVYVTEFHSEPVSVIGAVAKPGIYQLTGPRSLIEMLSLAGGLAQVGTAPGRTLLVTRKGGFGENFNEVKGMKLISSDKLEIDLNELLNSREDALNIPIRPFDTISVSKADIVYVAGDVRKPGGYVMGEGGDLTILKALALAEGVNVTAKQSQTRIIRQGPNGTRVEIPVDLKKVLDGKAQDLELAANDILFVPNSASKSAAKRAAEAAVATVSGFLIYHP